MLLLLRIWRRTPRYPTSCWTTFPTSPGPSRCARCPAWSFSSSGWPLSSFTNTVSFYSEDSSPSPAQYSCCDVSPCSSPLSAYLVGINSCSFRGVVLFVKSHFFRQTSRLRPSPLRWRLQQVVQRFCDLDGSRNDFAGCQNLRWLHVRNFLTCILEMTI